LLVNPAPFWPGKPKTCVPPPVISSSELLVFHSVFWVLKFCKFPVTLNRSPVVPEMYPPAPMLTFWN